MLVVIGVPIFVKKKHIVITTILSKLIATDTRSRYISSFETAKISKEFVIGRFE